jgi:hypothetical protein
MSGTSSTLGGNENVYNILIIRPQEMRQLGRPRHSWKDNNKMDVERWVVKVWTTMN